MTREEASRELVERWQRIHKEMVLGPVFSSLVRAGAEYAAGLLLGTNGPTSLLDTRPLRTSLANRTLIDWDVINDNLQAQAQGLRERREGGRQPARQPRTAGATGGGPQRAP